ncbi:MAG: ShlB/FhaC/HecB family hemolysin secretion/activation protein [Cytophagales bacterium]|nr:ShlB/FhaC/HecB family hemolysin secretion/activation protein [Cytophagales bacterium]
MNIFKTAPLSLLLLGLIANNAWSQTLPPTGEVGKGLLPQVPPSKEVSPISVPPLAKGAVAPSSPISVTVTSFVFSGNTEVSTEELRALVAPKLGEPLDLAGLDAVADSVSRFYRAKGYTVARAYLPAQKSEGGVIQIAVIEGRYGAVNIKNNSDVEAERLRLTVANNLCNVDDGKDCIGKTVKDGGLERAILLLKDLPGTTASAELSPGLAVGTSNLNIEAAITKKNTYSLGFDNYGSPSTGTTRLNANADLNNLAQNGDQLSLGFATTSQTATKTGSASYSLPVGYKGARLGFAFARNQYRLGASFEKTQSHGISNAVSAFTSYPIIRSINNSLYIRASGEVRGGTSSIDVLDGTSTQSFFKTNANVFRLGLSGDVVDDWGGGGYTAYGVTASEGYIGTNDVTDANPTAGAHVAGRFGKINYNLARQQALVGALTLYGALSGQTASKNLDGSEQTGIGGPGSVRGYSGEAGGSIGANATVELRYTTPIDLGDELANVTYGLFVDRGWVQFYKTVPSAVTGSNSRALSSYGLTLTLQSQAKVQTPTSIGYFVRAMYGRHGMAPEEQSLVYPTSRSKFWLQGGLNF